MTAFNSMGEPIGLSGHMRLMDKAIHLSTQLEEYRAGHIIPEGEVLDAFLKLVEERTQMASDGIAGVIPYAVRPLLGKALLVDTYAIQRACGCDELFDYIEVDYSSRDYIQRNLKMRTGTPCRHCRYNPEWKEGRHEEKYYGQHRQH